MGIKKGGDLRVAIFIDGAYLEKVNKNEFGLSPIDFGKLSQVMANGKEILRTYYYNHNTRSFFQTRSN